MKYGAKGISLIEITVVASLVGMLSLIMIPTFTYFRETSHEKTATQSLEIVRSALLTNYNSRGSWATDEASLDTLYIESGSASSQPSMSPRRVSVSLLPPSPDSPGIQRVGLAVKGGADRCYSLVVYPPRHNNATEIVKTKLSPGEPCSGSTAQ